MKTITLILISCLLIIGCGNSQKVVKKTISPDTELFAVNPGNKFGFINIEGDLVIEPKYEYAHDFSEGLAAVRTGGKWGFIDKSGKMAIPPKFDCVYRKGFSQGLAAATLGDPEGKKNNGYIDKSGNWAIKPQFDIAEPFTENVAVVTIDYKNGLINKKGEYIVTPQYNSIRNISGGLAAFQKEPGAKWGYIDLNGNEVIAPRFDLALAFSEGLAEVELEGKKGFIDKKGEVVIPIEFDDVKRFSGGLAAVEKNRQKYFIDKTGKTVIPPELAVRGVFVNGLACGLKNNDKFAIIDKTGKEIAILDYFFVHANPDTMKKGLIHVSIGGEPDKIEAGLVNLEGKLVYQWEWDGSSSLVSNPCASEKK